eukprot:6162446-Pleurochrysis_carterae.AAC.1
METAVCMRLAALFRHLGASGAEGACALSLRGDTRRFLLLEGSVELPPLMSLEESVELQLVKSRKSRDRKNALPMETGNLEGIHPRRPVITAIFPKVDAAHAKVARLSGSWVQRGGESAQFPDGLLQWKPSDLAVDKDCCASEEALNVQPLLRAARIKAERKCCARQSSPRAATQLGACHLSPRVPGASGRGPHDPSTLMQGVHGAVVGQPLHHSSRRQPTSQVGRQTAYAISHSSPDNAMRERTQQPELLRRRARPVRSKQISHTHSCQQWLFDTRTYLGCPRKLGAVYFDSVDFLLPASKYCMALSYSKRAIS